MGKKVFVAFGTRPEAIKMGPVVGELKKRAGLDTVVCVTGQHKEMLGQALSAFRIEPDYDLAVMRESQSLASVTCALIESLAGAIALEKPDIAVVHGDTATTFAAALSAFYLGVPVAHVEAGLRTGRLDSPFPEEFNRQSVGILAALHFAPTEAARQNLLKEKKDPSTIFVTGNTAIDALRYTVRAAYRSPELERAKGKRLILLTAHRRESWGERLESVFRAVLRISQAFPDAYILYPVHPNPAVRNAATKALGGHERIRLIEPLDAVDFHNYLKASYMVLTDSGGIQEEAPFLGKPVLVLRDETERPEGVETGALRLVGTGEEAVFKEASRLLTDRGAYRAMAEAPNPYGDGFASVRIADRISACLLGNENAI
jgi:UDP-N-acetylglucosamine 2-epimerase (non-hydrolysing)